jgi:hypothetical protein
VLCPGTRTDRRAEQRGPDRRATVGPCPHYYGRVQPGGLVYTRWKRIDQSPAPAGQVPVTLWCPCCQGSVELVTVAVTSEAA